MKPENKIEFVVPDKYFKNPAEDLIIGVIRYLRELGKTCDFLGFTTYPGKFLGFKMLSESYVILIDGIKYYGGVAGNIETNYYATFFVVNDEEHDYIENHRKKRVSQIQQDLSNQNII